MQATVEGQRHQTHQRQAQGDYRRTFVAGEIRRQLYPFADAVGHWHRRTLAIPWNAL